MGWMREGETAAPGKRLEPADPGDHPAGKGRRLAAGIIDVILAGHARTWEPFTEPYLLMAPTMARAGEACPKGSVSHLSRSSQAWSPTGA